MLLKLPRVLGPLIQFDLSSYQIFFGLGPYCPAHSIKICATLLVHSAQWAHSQVGF